MFFLSSIKLQYSRTIIFLLNAKEALSFFKTDDDHAISRQEKRRLPKSTAPRKDGILYPCRVVLGLPSPSHGVCADGQTDGRTDGRSRDYYITTKISRIDRLPNFLSNGAPLAGFARRLRYHHGFPLFIFDKER